MILKNEDAPVQQPNGSCQYHLKLTKSPAASPDAENGNSILAC